MDKPKTTKFIVKSFDFVLFSLIVISAILGLLCINSATYSTDTYGRDVLVQLVAFVIGLVAMAIILCIDYSYFEQLHWVIFGISIAVLVLVLIIGIGSNEVGTKGWIKLGPVNLQPAEIAKIGFIITFSAHITKIRDKLNEPKNVLLLCLHFGIFVGLVLLQPDWGTAMVFAFIFIGMLFVAKISWKYILAAIGALAVIGPILWFFVFKSYQIKRVLVFLHPETDPLGDGYQVMQSKMAIGSGQLLGNGYMQGTQTQMGFLPQSRTDFIYAVVGEEWGFIGSILVLALLMLIVWRCIECARNAKDGFGELICIGVASMFLFHIFENIGMCIGLMPVTGIPLPFFSYGGSSIITNCIALALVLNVNMRRKTINF